MFKRQHPAMPRHHIRINAPELTVDLRILSFSRIESRLERVSEYETQSGFLRPAWRSSRLLWISLAALLLMLISWWVFSAFPEQRAGWMGNPAAFCPNCSNFIRMGMNRYAHDHEEWLPRGAATPLDSLSVIVKEYASVGRRQRILTRQGASRFGQSHTAGGNSIYTPSRDTHLSRISCRVRGRSDHSRSRVGGYLFKERRTSP